MKNNTLTNAQLNNGESLNGQILNNIVDFQRQKMSKTFVPDRESRIRAIDKAASVLRNNTFTFSGETLAVKSESRADIIYLTTRETCTCPAYVEPVRVGGEPRYCKHRASFNLAKSFVSVINALND